MVTIPVNIAVFAVFWQCVEGALLLSTEFKPLRAIRQPDMWRYGWHRRQECQRLRQGFDRFRHDVAHQGAGMRCGWAGITVMRLVVPLVRRVRSRLTSLTRTYLPYEEAIVKDGWYGGLARPVPGTPL